MVRKRRDRPHYLNLGPYPGYVGIVFSEDAYVREMRRLGVNRPPQFARSGKRASTYNFTHSEYGETNLVCFDEAISRGKTIEQIHALLSHEAVHVKQNILADMGERCSGNEQEAHLVQYITQGFMVAWRKHRATKR